MKGSKSYFKRQMTLIKIGTRGSRLALSQASLVRDVITTVLPGAVIEIIIIKTKGDKILDVALSKIGDKGLFTKELEQALLQNEIDIAVHSLKDMPTSLPEGLHIGAVTEREDRRDALVSKDRKPLRELGPDDLIATSSLRRRASLLRYNDRLKITDIRGNVNTRLRKMESGECQAMVMAVAGLKRLRLEKCITEILSPSEFMPAVGQGALGLEVRADDDPVNELLSRINHQPTWTEVLAERAFLQKLEGGCLVPAGCLTVLKGTELTVSGFVSSTDGSEYLEGSVSGKASQPSSLGIMLAEKLIGQGGDILLKRIRKEHKGS
jgi:hydroxymethylbilane synthase